MRFVYTLFLVFVISSEVSGQDISGRVLDSVTLQPLAMATVSILNPDSLMIIATITDSAGSYILRDLKLKDISTGKYYLRYTLIGYSDRHQHLTIADSIKLKPGASIGKIQIPDIVLSKDPQQLQAVIVQARGRVIEQRTDGLVYNASNDVAIAGANAADLLKRVPLLTVDQNGNLSIIGKNSIRVFIDNRPSDLFAASVADALKQIPAAEIDRVEVITSPSSKYEAEGTDAVINIITKRGRYNGTNTNLRTQLRSFSKDFSVGIKIRKNKFSYNVDLGTFVNNYHWTEGLSRDNIDLQDPGSLLQESKKHNRYWSYFGTMEVVKMIDSLKTISLSYRFRDGESRTSSSTYNDYTVKEISKFSYTRGIKQANRSWGHSVNFGYTSKSVNKKNEFNLTGYFFNYDGTDRYDLEQERDEIIDYKENSYGTMNNRELVVQADEIYKPASHSKIELGARTAFRNFDADNNIAVYDFATDNYLANAGRSNSFRYKRAIHAAYANYTFNFREWNFRIGARYEITTLKARFDDTGLAIPNYKNFVPDILINRKIGEQNTIRFSYKQVIQRPFLQNLNPNINYMDSLNISFGNPYLLPSNRHSFQLVHTFTKQSWSWTNNLFHNRNLNNVENVIRLRGDGILETTYQNIGKAFDAGVISGLALSRQTGLSFNVSVSMRYVSIKSPGLNLGNNGFAVGSNLNVSYRFNKTLAIEASAGLNPRTFFLQGYETRWKPHSLMISKKLFNEKLNITAGGGDFLFGHQKISTAAGYGNFLQKNYYRYPSRMFRIGISYSFGKTDLTVHQSAQAGAGEN